MRRMIGLAATLVVGLALGWMATRTPSAPVHPAVDEFQLARAMADIEVIAQRGHPIGSADHDRVRDYLLGRMRQLGLEVRTQTGVAAESRKFGKLGFVGGGAVENLIGVLPGKDRSLPPLVVQAHYDSVSNSPGAADDSTGVAVALDVARAIEAKGQPTRDVVLLLTDGEESGLLGARAFYDHDPLAGRIGMVLNMEARGGGGRVSMFETSNDNGQLIDAFRKVTPNSTSTSLAVFMYKHMPNDTDLTVVKQKGLAGLNYAFIGSEFDYHANSSTPANQDRGSVQHMGQQVLATAKAFAYAPTLPGKAPDKVYSDVLGHVIVAYPPWVGWLVWLAGVGLSVAALARARREEPLSWVEGLKGVAALLLATIATGALALGARRLSGSPMDFAGEHPLLAQFDRFEIALTALGLASLVLIFALLAGWRPKPWSAWAGVLAVGALLSLAAQILAPTVGFLTAWPLLVAAVIAMIAAYPGKGSFSAPASLAAMVVLGGLSLGQTLYVFDFVVLGIGVDVPPALAPLALLVALILTPLLWSRARWQVLGGAAALALGVAVVLLIRFTDPASPRHPRLTEVYYVAEADTGKFWRVSALPDDDAWTKAVLGADGGKTATRAWTGFGDKVLMAPAAPIVVAKPQVTVEKAADGRVTVHVIQAADARDLRLSVTSDKPVKAVTVNGERKPMGLREIKVRWSAPGKPVDIVLETAPGSKLDLAVAELREGWPRDAKPLPTRPADAMAWGASDMTVSTVNLKP